MSYLDDSIKMSDPVRPGEQWFCYWKTSAALWENKILQFSQHEVIFIPLYWGFHAESPGEWDFGNHHPERDLVRLVHVLMQHKRKFVWLLPLGPAPFLPNGGVPAWAARTLAVSLDGVHHAVLDQDGKLHKMFSFFEPKVFQSYSQFLKKFGSLLGEKKIKAPVWGAEFNFFQDGRTSNFFDDQSLAFEQGFSRFLKQNNPEGNDLSEPKLEQDLKTIFRREVLQLFKTTAQMELAPFWSGSQSIVVLGAGPKDTIERSLSDGKSQLEFTKDLFNHYLHNSWISSALLSKEEKKDLLEKILREHFGTNEINHRYQYEAYGAELDDEFRPFGIVDIFGDKNSDHFQKIGLLTFLKDEFRWLYQLHSELNFTPAWIDINQHKIKIFHSRELDRTKFAQILKLFMMGQKILLDKENMNPELEKRLQVFLMENNLKQQTVNFLTPVNIIELGEGRLITFEGDKLRRSSDQENFWRHIFKYLNLTRPELKMDEDVFSLWRIRASNPHELSYLDVRRVNFYNPTSYKKQVVIRTHKHFAFMKMIDPVKAEAKSTPEGVVVELLPNGKIALDFGHYEET